MRIEKHLPWLIPVSVLFCLWALFTGGVYLTEKNDFNRVPSFKETQINMFRFITGKPSVRLNQ